MTEAQFLRELDELFEVDSGTMTPETDLSATGHWDSITILGFMALVDEQFGIELQPKKIADARTVSDLIAMVQTQIEA